MEGPEDTWLRRTQLLPNTLEKFKKQHVVGGDTYPQVIEDSIKIAPEDGREIVWVYFIRDYGPGKGVQEDHLGYRYEYLLEDES